MSFNRLRDTLRQPSRCCDCPASVGSVGGWAEPAACAVWGGGSALRLASHGSVSTWLGCTAAGPVFDGSAGGLECVPETPAGHVLSVAGLGIPQASVSRPSL